MTQICKWECFTFTAAARELGVAVWRVRYAVDSGYLPRPGVVFRRRALFSPGQVEGMRTFFGRDAPLSIPPGGPVAGSVGLPSAGPGTDLQP